MDATHPQGEPNPGDATCPTNDNDSFMPFASLARAERLVPPLFPEPMGGCEVAAIAGIDGEGTPEAWKGDQHQGCETPEQLLATALAEEHPASADLAVKQLLSQQASCLLASAPPRLPAAADVVEAGHGSRTTHGSGPGRLGGAGAGARLHSAQTRREGFAANLIRRLRQQLQQLCQPTTARHSPVDDVCANTAPDGFGDATCLARQASIGGVFASLNAFASGLPVDAVMPVAVVEAVLPGLLAAVPAPGSCDFVVRHEGCGWAAVSNDAACDSLDASLHTFTSWLLRVAQSDAVSRQCSGAALSTALRWGLACRSGTMVVEVAIALVTLAQCNGSSNGGPACGLLDGESWQLAADELLAASNSDNSVTAASLSMGEAAVLLVDGAQRAAADHVSWLSCTTSAAATQFQHACNAALNTTSFVECGKGSSSSAARVRHGSPAFATAVLGLLEAHFRRVACVRDTASPSLQCPPLFDAMEHVMLCSHDPSTSVPHNDECDLRRAACRALTAMDDVPRLVAVLARVLANSAAPLTAGHPGLPRHRTGHIVDNLCTRLSQPTLAWQCLGQGLHATSCSPHDGTSRLVDSVLSKLVEGLQDRPRGESCNCDGDQDTHTLATSGCERLLNALLPRVLVLMVPVSSRQCASAGGDPEALQWARSVNCVLVACADVLDASPNCTGVLQLVMSLSTALACQFRATTNGGFAAPAFGLQLCVHRADGHGLRFAVVIRAQMTCAVPWPCCDGHWCGL